VKLSFYTIFYCLIREETVIIQGINVELAGVKLMVENLFTIKYRPLIKKICIRFDAKKVRESAH
jgi:hypothetical protein